MSDQSGFAWDETYEAAADLSAKQFFGVGIDSAGKAALGGALTTHGVLQNKPTAGRAATVRHLGITRAVSDGSGTAIAAGDLVGCNSSGKFVKRTADNEQVNGIALDASSADGTIIRVALGVQGDTLSVA